MFIVLRDIDEVATPVSIIDTITIIVVLVLISTRVAFSGSG